MFRFCGMIWDGSTMNSILGSGYPRPTARALTAALCAGATASSMAFAQERWDKKACEIFRHARKAHICTFEAVNGFAALANELATLIAEQSVKSCDWAWREVYDQEGHLGVDFRQYLQTWTAEWVPLVLESRLPSGNPRPRTEIERSLILSYTAKLSKDCGAIR
jgi:hypothetical protein